jgi:hypothetical protein
LLPPKQIFGDGNDRRWRAAWRLHWVVLWFDRINFYHQYFFDTGAFVFADNMVRSIYRIVLEAGAPRRKR